MNGATETCVMCGGNFPRESVKQIKDDEGEPILVCIDCERDLPCPNCERGIPCPNRCSEPVKPIMNFPEISGFYWLRLNPVSDWQVVLVFIGGSGLGILLHWARTCVLFAGISERVPKADFVRDYPDARWGNLLEEPKNV